MIVDVLKIENTMSNKSWFNFFNVRSSIGRFNLLAFAFIFIWLVLLTFFYIRNTDLLQQELGLSETAKSNIEYTNNYLIILTIIVIPSLLLLLIWSSRQYWQPIQRISNNLNTLAQGTVTQPLPLQQDEFVEIVAASNQLGQNIANASHFATAIGQGQLQTQYQPSSQADTLGNALLLMRERLMLVAEEDRKRNWTTEGLAKFADILRAHYTDFAAFNDAIIQNLVRYVKANQGALFILNDDNISQKYLELTACYAYERKKYISKQIGIGEGLVGQCFLEQDTILMTDIPTDYVRITSGLGQATPTCLILVPLKMDKNVIGILELAAFQKFESYQIAFIEKVAENIASSIASTKIAVQTQKLLKTSQQQSEEMKAQEEELRQNMEELQATQDEMFRQSRYMEDLINAIDEVLFTVNTDLKIDIFNQYTKHFFQNLGVNIEKGSDVIDCFPAENKNEYRQYYTRCFLGEKYEMAQSIFGNNYQVQYNPILNKNGQVISAVVLAKNVTEIVKAKANAEKLYVESQEQNAMMKAQEEAMLDTFNDLQKAQDEATEQAKYLNSVLNALNDGIFVIDPNLQLKRFNQLASDFFMGLGLTLTNGMSIFDCFPPEVHDSYRQLYVRAFEGEAFQQKEEGFDSTFLVQYNPIFGRNKKVEYVVIMTKDITQMAALERQTQELLQDVQQKNEEMLAQEEELRQNMEELHATQEEMHRQVHYTNSIVNVIDEVIYAIDKDFKVQVYNQYTEIFLAQRRKSIEKGMNILSVFSSDVVEEQKRYYERCFAGEKFQVEKQAFGLSYLTQYNPVFDEQDNVVSVVVLAKVNSHVELENTAQKLA